MMKRLFFWNVLALAAIMLPANLMTQEVIEPVDSIWIDTVALITMMFLTSSEC